MQLLKCEAGCLRNVIFVVSRTTNIVIQHPMKVVNGLVQNVGHVGIKKKPLSEEGQHHDMAFSDPATTEPAYPADAF